MIETHLSFANRWECDENGHINVQFYYRWFDEAAQVFALKNGREPHLGNAVSARHVRYYKELNDGDATRIKSGQVSSGEHAGSIVHLLYNATTGTLAATALDTPKAPYVSDIKTDSENAGLAFPRGLDSGALSAFDSEVFLQNDHAIITHHSVVESGDLTIDGQFSTNRIISRFTQGAPHIWEHAGVTTQWLNANGNGRVAVEMKVCPIAPPILGSVLQLVSRVSDVAGKTMQVDHQLENMSDRSVIALGSVRCLVMNLTSRRAVELPDKVRITG